mmetsp:Transcript_37822/g.55705  ORF Transcript_37822/g.55705 Transcript_37822/m.55705 type:complete len:161 (+) Transcript_37822:174-656(+)
MSVMYCDCEGDVAFQFAERSTQIIGCDSPTPLPLTVDEFVESAAKSINVVILVASTADGSVGKPCRSLTRAMKVLAGKDYTNNDVPLAMPVRMKCAVALLGGARCTNSAESTRSEVYGSGRRFVKALKTAGLECSVVEVDVELEAPEVQFDGWLAGMKLE